MGKQQQEHQEQKQQYPGLGLVTTQFAQLCPQGLALDSGVTFGPLTVAYETYGTLSEARDNAIVVCHALSGGAHAAGWHADQSNPGWWDDMIGPGKAFDTDRYYVICANVLGGCYGTTGPSSIDPATGKPYGLRFPVVTIRDMVNLQVKLLDHLGIDSALAVTGGSMGGMMALQWAVSYPQRARSVIAIATTHRHSPQQIAFNELSRQSIMTDPAWNNGDYYGRATPRLGLSVACMTGHITYLSERGMEQKFGRRLRNQAKYGYDFSKEFEVETYLQHKGLSFVERFDANSLLYISKALDYFDLSSGFDSLTEAFGASATVFLLVAFSLDWLYPPQQLKDVAKAVRRSGGDATYYEVSSDYGHDAFLLDHEKQTPLIQSFLARIHREHE